MIGPVARAPRQGLTLPPLIRQLGLVTRDDQDRVLAVEIRRRLVVLALIRIDDLAVAEGIPTDVAERVRIGYEALLAHVDRRLDVLGDTGGAVDGAGEPVESETRAFEAEVELRRVVIATERDELDRMVTHRKVSQAVADEVRAALDVDETTMRP
jgi:hypothetical protein